MCPETNKQSRPKNQCFELKLRHLTISLPDTTCAVTAFTYTTSLDQIQCQVLNKSKQEMKLEAVKQKKKGSWGAGAGGVPPQKTVASGTWRSAGTYG